MDFKVDATYLTQERPVKNKSTEREIRADEGNQKPRGRAVIFANRLCAVCVAEGRKVYTQQQSYISHSITKKSKGGGI